MHDADGDKLPFIQERVNAGLPVRPEHEEPELWEAAAAVLNIYFEVVSGDALTFTELKSWSEFRCFEPPWWVIQALRVIDRINHSKQHDMLQAKRKSTK